MRELNYNKNNIPFPQIEQQYRRPDEKRIDPCFIVTFVCSFAKAIHVIGFLRFSHRQVSNETIKLQIHVLLKSTKQ